MTWSRSERSALCDLFLELGPEADTIDEGWDAADLAAHLVVRERRPDAALGMFLPPLSGHADRVSSALREKPWGELVHLVRTGPPWWMPASLPKIEPAINTVEFFVHHEDLRRAQPGWEPRKLAPRQEDALWGNVTGRFGSLMFRKSPVGIDLRRPDGRRKTVKSGPTPVTLTGEPQELLLYAFGRGEHARVEVEGEPGAVAALSATSLGM